MIRIIDKDKCIGCSLCVNDCVTHFIELVNNRASFKNRGRCICCGHCDSICPKDAIFVDDDDYNNINNKKTASKFVELMSKKRTVRNYDVCDAIKEDELDNIVLAAYSSPTEKNRKSSRIILIKEKLSEIYNLIIDSLLIEVNKTGSINPLYSSTVEMDKNRDKILWGAEYLVVIIGTISQLTESIIAAERMQLTAFEFKINSAYRGDIKLGINKSDELRSMLNIKQNEECLVSFILGKSSIRYHRKSIKLNHNICFM